MSTLPTLQTLPLHVVERIVNHVAGSIRNGSAESEDSHWQGKCLLPLMSVCHSFRAVALPRLCRHLKLALNDLADAQNVDCLSNASLGYPTHHLVKDLEFELNDQTIYSGRALRLLLNAPFGTCVFPLVRKLTLSLIWLDLDYSDGSSESEENGGSKQSRVEANIGAFIQWIREVMPLVGEIRITPSARSYEAGPIDYEYFGDLFLRLYQLVGRVDLDGCDLRDVSLETQFDSLSHLTHISYTSDGLGKEFIVLARQNAPTLQLFAFTPEDEDYDISEIFTDAGNRSVVFPRLLKLRLSIDSGAYVSRQPAPTGPAQFPCLRHLDLVGKSELDLFVFFRGNAAALEFLDIKLDSAMVALIRRHDLFTPTSHPNLHCVKIGFLEDAIPHVFATALEAMQFSLGVGPAAPVRKIGIPMSSTRLRDEMLLSAYSLLGDYACIQLLSLDSVALELRDALSLIKSLPLLTDLHTFSTRLGSMPAGVSKSDLPGYVVSNYYPTGERFRCWHIRGGFYGGNQEAIWCVLLVALACPAFDYAVGRTSNQAFLTYSMREVIASDIFSYYEPRLRRLL